MPLVENTEEIKSMKVRLIALTFGFFLAAGLPLAATAGPLPGGTDTDGDTVEDAFDNCTALSNAGQEDADHDGCGDVCDNGPIDADANGDTIVGGPDFFALSSSFGATSGGSADFSGDTIVGGPDFFLLSAQFGNFVGPSGITNPSRDLAECPVAP
jgi:hypothetical protein